VRIFLLSDIHANLEALNACVDAAPRYDCAVNLGDVVGYGADPNAVVDVVRGQNPLLVRGNHDKAVSGVRIWSTSIPWRVWRLCGRENI